jgi:hypothetical protein
MRDRPLRSGQVTITPIGGHGIGHGHWVYDRVMQSRSCHYWILERALMTLVEGKRKVEIKACWPA